jgi:hypothetical protein
MVEGSMAESLSRRAPRFVFLSDGMRSAVEAGRYGWRLDAANNRPIGRAIRAESSLAGCRAAAEVIHREIESPARSAVVVVNRGQWTWRVAFDGTPVAVCMHAYPRRVECVRALAQFTAAVVAAEPAHGVVRFFGPNSLLGYEPDRLSSAKMTVVS